MHAWFTMEVERAIAQVSEYREFFDQEDNRQQVKKKYDLNVYKPGIKVLIGHASNIDRRDLIRINDRYRYVKVITYGDLLKQLRYHLKYLKKFAGT